MIPASYFDGRSAALHPVQLALAGPLLSVAGATVSKIYPLAEAALAEPFDKAPAVIYFADGARCEVSGRAARDWLAATLGYRKPLAVRWQQRWGAALLGLALLVALVGSCYLWGIPAVAEGLATTLPPSLDTAIGTGALAALEEQDMLAPTRLSDELADEVKGVLSRVTPAHPRVPVRLALRAAPRLGANAFAFPDGTIVVTDGMVRRIIHDKFRGKLTSVQSAQLAGVLAHEIGHLERRHSVRLLARSSLTAAGSAALFGDFSAVAAAAPALLSNMRHSRAMETEADDYAAGVLRQRGIPTAPLADLFDAFDKDEDNKGSGWVTSGLDYVSSHPTGAARSARLRAAP